ncbi:Disintegrin and metalloproteinase domain-containing protein 10 [Nymphon striatum]|nr:Disintegrin and metalloproteinase domain-containing protein 10 [Nymphon striatum]
MNQPLRLEILQLLGVPWKTVIMRVTGAVFPFASQGAGSSKMTLFGCSEVRLRLNEFITHFEPLHYDHKSLIQEHHRVKRTVDEKKAQQWQLNFNFTAHQRVFSLHLYPDKSIFADDVMFDSTNGSIAFDTAKFFVGHMDGDEISSVHGVFTNEGLFDGTIMTRSEEFYIEPASRYFTSPENFHSVIYKASDVNFLNNSRPCHTQTFAESLKKSDPYQHLFESHDHTVFNKFKSGNMPDSEDNDINSNKYFQSANEESHKLPIINTHPSDGDDSAPSSTFSGNNKSSMPSTLHTARTKRSRETNIYKYASGVKANLRMNWVEEHAKKRTAIDPKKTTCMLYLQADHLFYKKMGSIEACIEQMTRHVQKVNNIYRVADFDQDGVQDNISFMIKRIKVHTLEALSDPKYRFPSNYGVEKFLELFSEEDYDSFCLAYMFTYRDFEGGTLGLAWTGDLKNAGGVCEKNGHYRGSLKSLNTGIVTLLNYGKHVPPAVSHVTLAHEIGHNFGSPHDPEDDRGCTPGGQDGNYIMFARATSGDKYNNQKFSPCSMRSISSVLSTKARGNKGCFTEPQDSICGNEVVEKGEECDCGWEEDCKEPCCFPMRSNPPRNEPPCTLRPNVICRKSNFLNDKIYIFTFLVVVQVKGLAAVKIFLLIFLTLLTGTGPKCPPSIHKPNRTICNDEFVCYMGECTGSICIAYGLEFCQCKRKPYELATKSCELCCKLPGQDHSCKSSFEWNSPPYIIPDMFAKPGTPCNDYSGYCDVFQKCREVDPSGPLATLRKLLLSNESMQTLKEWVIQHWWGVLFLAVGFVIFLVLVVRIFGKKPDRSKDIDINYTRSINSARDAPCHSNQVLVNAGCHIRPYNQRRSNTNRSLTTALARQNGNHLGVITALSPGECSHRAILHPKEHDRINKWV